MHSSAIVQGYDISSLCFLCFIQLAHECILQCTSVEQCIRVYFAMWLKMIWFVQELQMCIFSGSSHQEIASVSKRLKELSLIGEELMEDLVH